MGAASHLSGMWWARHCHSRAASLDTCGQEQSLEMLEHARLLRMQTGGRPRRVGEKCDLHVCIFFAFSLFAKSCPFFFFALFFASWCNFGEGIGKPWGCILEHFLAGAKGAGYFFFSMQREDLWRNFLGSCTFFFFAFFAFFCIFLHCILWSSCTPPPSLGHAVELAEVGLVRPPYPTGGRFFALDKLHGG